MCSLLLYMHCVCRRYSILLKALALIQLEIFNIVHVAKWSRSVQVPVQWEGGVLYVFIDEDTEEDVTLYQVCDYCLHYPCSHTPHTQ